MIEVQILPEIAALPAHEWNAFEGVDEAPFLSWEMLHTIEKTGCVGEGTGWTPAHLAFYDGGNLIGGAPAYLKENSEGEFVFDHAWADALRRAGHAYYPKLIVAAPFTPATGRRVLIKPGADRNRLALGTVETLRAVVKKLELSSAHVLFPNEADAELFETHGMARRFGVQFQWHNRGFATFEDFLSSFDSKRRAMIRRETREMEKQRVHIETLRGKDITPEIVDHVFSFYKATVQKFFWGRQYLNRKFFEESAVSLAGKVEVVIARRGGKIIAGAWNLAGSNALFGRYWGATEDVPFLHFNVCYYHSLREAITRNLSRFEPGAGGSHKKSRGFSPTITHSTHLLQHPGLDRVVRQYLEREREAIQEHVAAGGGDDD
ncbi:MAG: N-acetyltransferase [Polyangiaceae bacterium]|nr:N-acetyltransferase [Polyangiaceae bacterium]